MLSRSLQSRLLTGLGTLLILVAQTTTSWFRTNACFLPTRSSHPSFLLTCLGRDGQLIGCQATLSVVPGSLGGSCLGRVFQSSSPRRAWAWGWTSSAPIKQHSSSNSSRHGQTVKRSNGQMVVPRSTTSHCQPTSPTNRGRP